MKLTYRGSIKNPPKLLRCKLATDHLFSWNPVGLLRRGWGSKVFLLPPVCAALQGSCKQGKKNLAAPNKLGGQLEKIIINRVARRVFPTAGNSFFTQLAIAQTQKQLVKLFYLLATNHLVAA